MTIANPNETFNGLANGNLNANVPGITNGNAKPTFVQRHVKKLAFAALAFIALAGLSIALAGSNSSSNKNLRADGNGNFQGSSAQDDVESCDVDVIFIVDASGSIKEERFGIIKTFVNEVARELFDDDLVEDLGLGFVKFHTGVTRVLSLKDNVITSENDLLEFQNIVNATNYDGGVTCTAGGLENTLNNDILNPSKRDVLTKVVLITDGLPNKYPDPERDNCATDDYCVKCRNGPGGPGADADSVTRTSELSTEIQSKIFGGSNVEIVTVGIGNVDEAFMQEISDEYLYVDSIEVLPTIVEDLKNLIDCPNDHPIEPTSEPTTKPTYDDAWPTPQPTGEPTETSITLAPTAAPTQCYEDIDVVFVVDASGSIGEENFALVQMYVKDLAASFASTSRFSLVVYETGVEPLVLFGDDASVDLEQFKTAVDDINYTGGVTCTAGGLENAFKTILPDRRGSGTAVILITDGLPNKYPIDGEDTCTTAAGCIKCKGGPGVPGLNLESREATKTAAAAIRDLNSPSDPMKLITVGIGSNIDEAYLDSISDLSVKVDNFGDLDDVVDEVKDLATCDDVNETEPECYKSLDVMFVVDNSGSIGADNFDLVREYVKDLAAQMSIDTESNRYDLTTFSTGVSNLVKMGSAQSTILELFNEKVDEMVYEAGVTCTQGGLGHSLVSTVPLLRDEPVHRTLILITDGIPNKYSRVETDTCQTSDYCVRCSEGPGGPGPHEDSKWEAIDTASSLELENVNIITVGISNNVDEEFLSAISEDFVRVTNFDDLTNVVEIVAELAKCKTDAPTMSPTGAPTLAPTKEPTESPSFHPTEEPTAAPTFYPTESPTVWPTASPTPTPTESPTVWPTASPTPTPTEGPTDSPTFAPTLNPTGAPTMSPTFAPTLNPTEGPTMSPTFAPTLNPTDSPTMSPTFAPTLNPTGAPTMSPTFAPTLNPTEGPTMSPTFAPTLNPTEGPTDSPTLAPTLNPTDSPTMSPTFAPTLNPTEGPTESPTLAPTLNPTEGPTMSPTYTPTTSPTQKPTGDPTGIPTSSPTVWPTSSPTPTPTESPTENPTVSPSLSPTGETPIQPTSSPTTSPTTNFDGPTDPPTLSPTVWS